MIEHVCISALSDDTTHRLTANPTLYMNALLPHRGNMYVHYMDGIENYVPSSEQENKGQREISIKISPVNETKLDEFRRIVFHVFSVNSKIDMCIITDNSGGHPGFFSTGTVKNLAYDTFSDKVSVVVDLLIADHFIIRDCKIDSNGYILYQCSRENGLSDHSISMDFNGLSFEKTLMYDKVPFCDRSDPDFYLFSRECPFGAGVLVPTHAYPYLINYSDPEHAYYSIDTSYGCVSINFKNGLSSSFSNHEGNVIVEFHSDPLFPLAGGLSSFSSIFEVDMANVNYHLKQEYRDLGTDYTIDAIMLCNEKGIKDRELNGLKEPIKNRFSEPFVIVTGYYNAGGGRWPFGRRLRTVNIDFPPILVGPRPLLGFPGLIVGPIFTNSIKVSKKCSKAYLDSHYADITVELVFPQLPGLPENFRNISNNSIVLKNANDVWDRTEAYEMIEMPIKKLDFVISKISLSRPGVSINDNDYLVIEINDVVTSVNLKLLQRFTGKAGDLVLKVSIYYHNWSCKVITVADDGTCETYYPMSWYVFTPDFGRPSVVPGLNRAIIYSSNPGVGIIASDLVLYYEKAASRGLFL